MPTEITLESGFSVLIARMREYLSAHEVPAEFAAGWLARPKQATRPGGSRIVIGPSEEGGRGGRIIPAMGPGVRVEGDQAWCPIAGWEMQLACYVWATDKTSEEAQVSATFGLMQWAMRAIAYASNGWYTFAETDWTKPETTTQLGKELKLSFTARSHVVGEVWGLVGPLAPNIIRGPLPDPPPDDDP